MMNTWISVLVGVCVFQQIIFLNSYFELVDFSSLDSYIPNLYESFPTQHLYINQTLANIKPELENIYHQLTDYDFSPNYLTPQNIAIFLILLAACYTSKLVLLDFRYEPNNDQIDEEDLVIREEKITQIHCPVCTFLNNEDTVSCVMCETMLFQ